MDALEPFEAARMALAANKLRSALTTLGIVIGVAAVIVVVSLVGALERLILNEIERMGSHTLFVRPAEPGDLPPEEYAKLRDRTLTLEEMRALARVVPQVTHVTPLTFIGTELRANGRAAGIGLIMTDDSFIELGGVGIKLGRNFVPSDLRLRSKVVIVGPKLLEKLAITGNPIGRIVQTPALSLEIVGVLEEQGATLGNDPDSNALIPLTTGMPLLPDEQRRHLLFQVRVDPRTNPDDSADLVREALRRIKGLRPNEREGFAVFSPKQVATIVGKISGWIAGIAGGMVSIALVVGGIGIMNIMLVSVTERTREIGIRKAVGAKRRDVMLQFLIEASLLSVLGGAAGLALGYGAGAALGKALVGAVGLIPLWAAASAFGVPAVIGIVFGLYPAFKASRLDPVEALRYE